MIGNGCTIITPHYTLKTKYMMCNQQEYFLIGLALGSVLVCAITVAIWLVWPETTEKSIFDE